MPLSARAVTVAGPGWRPKWTDPRNNVKYTNGDGPIQQHVSAIVLLAPQPHDAMPTMEGALNKEDEE